MSTELLLSTESTEVHVPSHSVYPEEDAEETMVCNSYREIDDFW